MSLYVFWIPHPKRDLDPVKMAKSRPIFSRKDPGWNYFLGFTGSRGGGARTTHFPPTLVYISMIPKLASQVCDPVVYFRSHGSVEQRAAKAIHITRLITHRSPHTCLRLQIPMSSACRRFSPQYSDGAYSLLSHSQTTHNVQRVARSCSTASAGAI